MRPEEKLLAKLVTFQTTPKNHGAQLATHDFIIKQLTGLPIYIKSLQDGDGVITVITTQQTLRPKILFVCHVDVVTADTVMFSMRTDANRMYGRGVWDMKYAIAGMISVMQDLGSVLSEYDFGLAITSDEETTNHNMQYILDNGVAPECVVILDGGENWQLESGSKGCWTVKVSAAGRTAHGSRPWEGESAVDTLLDALSKIRSHFEKQGPLTPTLNISMLEGGAVQNQIPNQANAVLDIRFVTENEGRIIEQIIKKIASEHSLSLETLTEMIPVTHDMQNVYLRSFENIASEVLKHHPKPVLSQGASDASVCINHGIPAIVTRPLGGGHHSDQEWIDRASFALFGSIIKKFIVQMAA